MSVPAYTLTVDQLEAGDASQEDDEAPYVVHGETSAFPRHTAIGDGQGIYFIEAVGTRRIKIGLARDSARQRLTQLQTGCPFPLRLLATLPGDAADEAYLHEHFSSLRVDGSREWFHISDDLSLMIYLLTETDGDSATDRLRYWKHAAEQLEEEDAA